MQDHTQGSGIRPIFLGMGLIAIASLLGLLLGEVAMRAFGYRGATIIDLTQIVHRVDDPVVDYRYHRNATSVVGDVTYHFNSAGFRDVDHEPAAKPGVTRIAMVGDSIIDGAGVEGPDMFQARVQRRLGDDIELITIAMSGLNTQQEVHLFEREGLPFDPDLVVLNVVLNDCLPGASFQGAGAGVEAQGSKIHLLDIRIDPRVKRLLLSSALLYTLKQRFENLMAAGRAGGNEDPVARPWAREGYRERVRDGIRQLAELRDARDLNVVVLIWPALVDFHAYSYSEIHAWIRQQAEEQGFEVLDLLPAFAELESHREVIQNDFDVFHPNPLGHDLAAEAFTRWYRSAFLARARS